MKSTLSFFGAILAIFISLEGHAQGRMSNEESERIMNEREAARRANREALPYGYKDRRISSNTHFYEVTPKDLIEVPGNTHQCIRSGNVERTQLTCIVYWSASMQRHYRVAYTTVPANREPKYIALSVERENAPRSGLYERVGKLYDLRGSVDTAMFAQLVEVGRPETVAWSGSSSVAASGTSQSNERAQAPQVADADPCVGISNAAEKQSCETAQVAKKLGDGVKGFIDGIFRPR